ncbi:hypothetical protein [Campylobacter geochelonis]|nr:hypothetical protein [Campylobacter geochelonis]
MKLKNGGFMESFDKFFVVKFSFLTCFASDFKKNFKFKADLVSKR